MKIESEEVFKAIERQQELISDAEGEGTATMAFIDGYKMALTHLVERVKLIESGQRIHDSLTEVAGGNKDE